ncbi:hypothetical protein KCMC57_up01640 [Kitasatospora sp. CMC57]|uniref:A-factor biosynthesis hotdog domain-containing protein n=1 Tax=Kitasatospora sp. CMC57 TaxID=3231513 RepID=A0AB33JKB2_9ACTN
MTLRLSVLDQTPVGEGSGPDQALRSSLELAQALDPLGFTRYWAAEHHGSPGFAGTAPGILDHPVLFDHPVDHAPDMLLLEATRQAARATHPALPVAMDAAFFRWVELDAPCWITAESLGHPHARITAVQHDRTVFSATLTSQGL